MQRDRTAEYAKGNTEAAAIILAGDPQTFGAGLRQWAEMHLARHGQHGAPVVHSVGTVTQEPEQMRLFPSEASECQQ